jgi:hypothetical protein
MSLRDGAHLRRASALLGRPLAGVRELESLAEEMKARDRLLLRVEQIRR